MNNGLSTRRAKYYELSTHLAHIDNEQLQALFDEGDKTEGWGANHVITLGESKIFVKSIPLTEIEYQQMFSTKNLYELPTYYNYGVGSAGFGSFRELVMHIKTTNWVLAGTIENFPLMYHYRLVPSTRTFTDLDEERFKRYVTYWNSNENIKTFMLARRQAAYEIILFLEHIPHSLLPWLDKNLDKLELVLKQLWDSIAFLRGHNIIHFDANFDNIVTDGEQFYLTDFGLVLDKRFDLTVEERQFFETHIYYDYGSILACLDWPIIERYRALEEADKNKFQQSLGLDDGASERDVLLALSENIRQIQTEGWLTLDEKYMGVVLHHQALLQLMNRFYGDLRQNQQKNTPYPQAEIKRLLEEAGILAEKGGPESGA